MEINKQELCKFLVEAKKATYASGDFSGLVRELDKSKTLKFERGIYKYHDNYFGGEPFGGREVVFINDTPTYMMVYYGGTVESIGEFDEIYKFMREALSLIPEESPYRGPKEYKRDNLVYLNKCSGEIDNFFGEEKIFIDNKEVYSARYAGGLVDQK